MSDRDPRMFDPTLGETARVLVLDGAMGTELARLGQDTGLPLWSAGPLLRAPEVVTAVHAAYLEAGADVLTTNTFRTNPRTFERAGLGREAARAATRQAVACAREALARAGRPALVAGSVAPLEDCYHPDLVPGEPALAEEHALLAGWLAEEGVDVLLLETMGSEREALAATRAAVGTGLPTWVAFIVGPDPGRLLSGERLQRAAAAVLEAGACAVGVNCVRPDPLAAALAHLATLGVPLLGYANGGIVDPGRGWRVDTELTAAEWTAAAGTWIACGARLVGGCCGTGPAVTGALRNAVDKLARGPYDPGSDSGDLWTDDGD